MLNSTLAIEVINENIVENVINSKPVNVTEDITAHRSIVSFRHTCTETSSSLR